MRVTSRPLLMLISSGTVLLLGVILVATPLRGKTWVVVGVLAALCVLLVLQPTAALAGLESALLGLLLVAVAGFVHRYLSRRMLRKQTVFPDPQLLVRPPGSSARALPPAGARGDPARVVLEPPEPAPLPRARSSSVR
jgi:hypothetical protein